MVSAPWCGMVCAVPLMQMARADGEAFLKSTHEQMKSQNEAKLGQLAEGSEMLMRTVKEIDVELGLSREQLSRWVVGSAMVSPAHRGDVLQLAAADGADTRRLVVRDDAHAIGHADCLESPHFLPRVVHRVFAVYALLLVPQMKHARVSVSLALVGAEQGIVAFQKLRRRLAGGNAVIAHAVHNE